MPEFHIEPWEWGTFPSDGPPNLSRDVATWIFHVDAEALGVMSDTLSPIERQRAARFERDHDRRVWIQSRVGLRRILGWLTDQPAGEVVIAVDEFGKPFLPQSDSRRSLEFSLSHSGALCAIAATQIGPVGIDLEAVTTRAVLDELLEDAMSPSERAWVLNNPEPEVAFCRLWSRKEAVVKALGTGFPADLRDLFVMQPPAPSSDDSAPIVIEGLHVIDIPSRVDYCAALAIRPGLSRATIFAEPHTLVR